MIATINHHNPYKNSQNNITRTRKRLKKKKLLNHISNNDGDPFFVPKWFKYCYKERSRKLQYPGKSLNQPVAVMGRHIYLDGKAISGTEPLNDQVVNVLKFNQLN